MKVIAYSHVQEKDGWVHEILVELDNGGRICVCDDSDSITVTASSPTITPHEAVTIWEKFAMGCSHFPAESIDAPKERPFLHLRLLHHIINGMDGEQFSMIGAK